MSVPMSEYEQKLTAAKAIIEEHNQALSSEEQIGWDNVLSCLRKLGGTSVDSLAVLKWEDLQNCGVPCLLARRISTEVFRIKKPAFKTSQVALMSFEELFYHYDPTRERNPMIFSRLQTESNGKRCVVFNPDNSINAKLSAEMLREIHQGFPEREFVTDPNAASTTVLLPVYKVGDSPNQFFKENPLFPGECLRPDGTCTQTGFNWSPIDDRIRKILYLAVKETGEIDEDGRTRAIDLLQVAEYSRLPSLVETRYPKAFLSLTEKIATGQEPRLLIRRQNGKKGKGGNDPFYSGHVRT